jgi:hypothetical protein
MSEWALTEKTENDVFSITATCAGHEDVGVSWQLAGEPPNLGVMKHALLVSVLTEDEDAQLIAAPEGLLTQDAIDADLQRARELSAMMANARDDGDV